MAEREPHPQSPVLQLFMLAAAADQLQVELPAQEVLAVVETGRQIQLVARLELLTQAVAVGLLM